MDALISAQAGTALLIEGTKLASIHAHAPEQTMPRRAEEVHLLFGEGLDLQVLQGVDRDQVVRRLAREADSAEALQLALILLDPEMPGEIRTEAAEELDGLLAKEEYREGLERVLYAHPFPSEADLSGALAHSEGHSPRVQNLLYQLVDLQPSIAEVRSAWTDLPNTLFVNPAERQRFQAALVREGLFRELVLVRKAGTSVESFLVTALIHPVPRKFQGYRPAMQAWVAPFRRQARTTERREQALEVAEEVAVPGRERRLSFDRKTALNKVDAQKKSIVNAMQAGDLGRVREYVSSLVEYNLAYGGEEYAAKSLCDLAMKAKDLGLTELQLELTQKSVEVKPDDGWAWAQHGDALLTNGLHDSALDAFANATSFGNLAAGNSGQAEVMRSLGRFAEALAAYDSVIERFPENVVARTGRAETLRSLGRLDEALAAYDAVLKQFPHDLVARNSRSGVLGSLGLWEEALEHLPKVRPIHLQDWIGYHIRGMALLRLERFEEAERIFRDGVENCPLPAQRDYFRTAMAALKVWRQEFSDASAVLEGVETSALKLQVDLLRLHSFGAEGEQTKAVAAEQRLQAAKASPEFHEVRVELKRRYIEHLPAAHSEDWLRERELALLLAVVAAASIRLRSRAR
jgi:tetratricopeptide (TPR) repeat protein